jgi:voltage-gated potassium channel
VRVVGIAVGATLLYALLPLRGDRWWLAAIAGVVAIGAVVPFTIRRAQAIATAQRPMVVAAEAVFLLLVLVVYGFSAVYLTLDRRAGEFDGLNTRVDAVYFTVTTLSTVGFGDINATGQTARMLVTIQVLFDLTLLAFAVRVLGVAAQYRRAESTTDG